MKKNSFPTEAVNYFLLCASLLIGIATLVATHAGARYNCVEPPIDTSSFRNSWHPDQEVQVRIDDAWPLDERNAIASGVAKWNESRFINCSGVLFKGFEPIHFANEAEYLRRPPNYTVYFQRHEHGSNYLANISLYYGGNPERVVATKIEIDPPVENHDGYFNYTATHELGHSFGLGNCLCAHGCCSPGLSIMGGHHDFAFNTGGLPRATMTR